MARATRFVVIDCYLPDKARDASHHASQRGPSWEKKMQKTILTIAGSALIVLSTIQFAAAASGHQGRHHRSATAQFRQSNAYAAPAQVELPGYGYGSGYYSHGFSAPAGQ